MKPEFCRFAPTVVLLLRISAPALAASPPSKFRHVIVSSLSATKKTGAFARMDSFQAPTVLP